MDFRPLVAALGLGLLLAAPVAAQQPEFVLPADTGSESSPAPPTQTTPRVAPIELKIPAIYVDAEVLPVGLAEDGAMEAPKDPDTVAWWSLGSGTGEPGNVVLAAHVDWGGRLRVFGLLHQLGPGDDVVLVDELARE